MKWTLKILLLFGSYFFLNSVIAQDPCNQDIIISCEQETNPETTGVPYFEGNCPLLPIPPSQLAPVQNNSLVNVTDINFNATRILGGSVISENDARSLNICYNNFGDSLIIEGELSFFYQDNIFAPGVLILHGVSGRDLPSTVSLSAGSIDPTVGGSQGEWTFQNSITGYCAGLEFENGWFYNPLNSSSSIASFNGPFNNFIIGECYDNFAFSQISLSDPADNFGFVIVQGGVAITEYDGSFPFRIAHKINNPNTTEIIELTFILTTDGASGGGFFPTRTDSILIPVEFVLVPNQVDVIVENDSTGFDGICQNQVIGTIERRFIATDICGLVDTCSQTIILQDTIAPRITVCPRAIRIFDGNLDPSNTGMPASIDNCGPSTIIYDDSFISQSDCLDSIRREFTFIDNCGNENFCAQLIIVQDTTFQDLSFPITNDGPQTCDDQEVFLIADGDFDGFTLNWEGPAGYSSSGDSSIASLAGIYYLKAIDSLTNCLFVDSTEVIDSCILPLDLVKFNANWFSESAAQINWETANEINIKHFELERSNDGFTYENISTFAALGNVSLNTNYSHKDPNLLAGEQFYYRLKIEETDGRIFYSQVIVLNKELTNTVLFNAFNNTLSIENNSAILKLNAAQIYNSIGQQIYARPIGILLEKGNHLIPLNHLNLNTGVYFLKVDFGNYQKVIRFFKY